MNESLRRALIAIYNQIHARKNLASIGDSRAWSLSIDNKLIRSAIIWPEVLPAKWKPQTIFDIGAYKGEVAASLSMLYRPKFMALVEPQPTYIERLEKEKYAQTQNFYNCALGRERGISTLYINASNASSSLLRVAPGCDQLFKRKMDEVGTIQVNIRTLDDIFISSGVASIDLIKLDVQGCELEVLAGGAKALDHTRVIVIEVSYFEHYIGQPLFIDIYSLLKEKGFDLISTFDFSFDQDGIPLQCDSVFINKALVQNK
jgi:FkbM family methyltransferase